MIHERLRGDAIGLVAYGALLVLCLAASILCLRYWRDSGDRLFAFFAVAFLLVGLNWTVLAVVYGWVWR